MDKIDFDNMRNSIKNLENKEAVQEYKHNHPGEYVMKNVTDGYHTFDELYHHRMVLTKIIFETYHQYAWKSWHHSDGDMFDDSFIVGVSIPGVGDYSYHYNKQYFDYFNVPEIPMAPEYDGHMPADINRLEKLLEL